MPGSSRRFRESATSRSSTAWLRRPTRPPCCWRPTSRPPQSSRGSCAAGGGGSRDGSRRSAIRRRTRSCTRSGSRRSASVTRPRPQRPCSAAGHASSRAPPPPCRGARRPQRRRRGGAMAPWLGRRESLDAAAFAAGELAGLERAAAQETRVRWRKAWRSSRRRGSARGCDAGDRPRHWGVSGAPAAWPGMRARRCGPRSEPLRRAWGRARALFC